MEVIMKAKNASGLVVGVILTVFVIILVGVIIFWTSGEFNSKKKTMDNSTAKIDRAIGSYSEFNFEIYDGKSLSGDAVKELISEVTNKGEVISIGVDTLDVGGAKYYNYSFTDKTADDSQDIGAKITPIPTPPTSKSDANYINPNGTFVGKVLKNANEEIICVLFAQQP
jgi:hypothetical protein